MLKRILLDPSFIFLVAINAYCIWYYQGNPRQFNSLLFLYWGQSILIGLFTFVELLTVKDFVPGSLVINDAPVDKSTLSKGCTAGFFLLHYGIFHLAYGIYILVYTGLDIDFHFVLLGLAAFSLSLIIEFARHKFWPTKNAANLGTMFFLPYLRIIPMHLMILGPAIFHWKASTIFLVLKTAADLIMYLVTSRLYKPDIINKTV